MMPKWKLCVRRGFKEQKETWTGYTKSQVISGIKSLSKRKKEQKKIDRTTSCLPFEMGAAAAAAAKQVRMILSCMLPGSIWNFGFAGDGLEAGWLWGRRDEMRWSIKEGATPIDKIVPSKERG